jgi:hypothetical protein
VPSHTPKLNLRRRAPSWMLMPSNWIQNPLHRELCYEFRFAMVFGPIRLTSAAAERVSMLWYSPNSIFMTRAAPRASSRKQTCFFNANHWGYHYLQCDTDASRADHGASVLSLCGRWIYWRFLELRPISWSAKHVIWADVLAISWLMLPGNSPRFEVWIMQEIFFWEILH